MTRTRIKTKISKLENLIFLILRYYRRCNLSFSSSFYWLPDGPNSDFESFAVSDQKVQVEHGVSGSGKQFINMKSLKTKVALCQNTDTLTYCLFSNIAAADYYY